MHPVDLSNSPAKGGAGRGVGLPSYLKTSVLQPVLTIPFETTALDIPHADEFLRVDDEVLFW